ncbi:MAG TPA: hypothetical protein VEH27_04935 [Methylomirabilota bacterium]|nr:hypothetical protein [Methylomirabilota bacterium]
MDGQERKVKLRWIILGLIGALLIAAGIFLYVQRESSRAAGDRLVEQLRAQGNPTSLADLAAAYNANRSASNPAPIYQAAFELLEKTGGKPGDKKAQERAFGKSGAYWPPPGAKFTASQLDAMREFVRTNQEALAALQAAAAQGGPVVLDLDFAAGPGMLLPHIAKFKNSAQGVEVACLLAISEGRKADAITHLTTLLRIQHALRAEPILVTYMVRLSMYDMGLGALERALLHLEFSSTEVEQLEKLLDLGPDQSALMNALKAERAFGLNIMDNPALMGTGNPGFKYAQALPSWDYDRLQYLIHLGGAVELATNSYPEVLTKVDELERQLAFRRGRYNGSPLKRAFFFLHRNSILTDMLLPALYGGYARQGEILARTRLARLALEAERRGPSFRPGALSDFADKLGSSALMDPFTGKPFTLVQTNNMTLVYSIGRDLVDNGGYRPGTNGEGEEAKLRGEPVGGPRPPRGQSDIVFEIR